MKRVAALFLALTLLFTFLGCSSEPKEKDAVDKFVKEKRDPEEAFVAFDKDADEMKDPLTICMDLEYVRELIGVEPGVILNEFLYTLEESGGLSDVEIVYVPKHGSDREAILDRIRVEIMSGGGPDVFIMNCFGSFDRWNEWGSDPLIAFPEQAMENGLFLPLDEYMKNNAVYAEWDKQNQAILAAGRNEEGQQVIPLSYTLPLICFKKTDVDIDLTGKSYTWDEMLVDPEISPYTRLLADCTTPTWHDGHDVSLALDGTQYVEFALGKIADFEKEELCFTEEELCHVIEDVVELHEVLSEASKTMERDTKGELDYFSTYLGSELVSGDRSLFDHFDPEDPLTMFPLYSVNGGVSASILSWAAVNRNTDRPEDAYTVIDLLMRDYVQKRYQLYEHFLCGKPSYSNPVGIPTHEGMLHPDMPLGSGYRWSLTEENYNEWCEVRSQITNAYFQSSVSLILEQLVDECISGSGGSYGYEYFVSIEQSVHEAYEKMQRLVRE